MVRKLREETGAGMMDCKSALVEANGDMAKARDILRKKAWPRPPSGRAGRRARAWSPAYIHPGSQIGVIVE